MQIAAPRIVLFLVACLLIAFTSNASEVEEGFTPLFKGRDLSGWHKEGGGATYKVDGDSIVGEVGPGPNTFLCTEKFYANFVLRLDVKLEVAGNSGIQIRSHQKDGNGRVFGYQCEIDPRTDRRWTGGIYDEGRRAWIYSLEGKDEARNAFKLKDWNSIEIVACGPSIKTFVNGVPCADLIDTLDTDGFIALQVHSGKEGRIRWRNVRIKELPATEWTPLGNLETLSGWQKTGGGDWKYEDGAIRGVSTASEKQYGHLLTEKEYGDFALRLKFKSLKGNSGVYFRLADPGNPSVRNFQAEIDPVKDVGGLYESGGRGWVVQPKPDDVKKYFKPEQWNEMSIVAIGKRIVVHVNGTKTADIIDEPSRTSGYIALQLHGGQDMDVWFRDVVLMDLSDLKCE